MSAKARDALNSAIVSGNMDYNVQLYAKILLENQMQSTAQHLRINEVNYESSTARHERVLILSNFFLKDKVQNHQKLQVFEDFRNRRKFNF